MSDFLLELRSEEIPARMQKGARAELEKLFRRAMDAAGVVPGGLTVWSTPRRLALIARDLPTETKAVTEEAKGPPEGAPDQAVDGFCRKNGVTRDQLEVREVKGRPTYFAVINTPGRAVKDVLAEAIPAIIRDFSWRKSQRWGAASISTESLRWVRPLSGIVALFDGEVVGCETHGIMSGNITRGHRFHNDGEITIGSADDYAETLRAAYVIVDHQERQAIIRDGAKKAAADAGLDLVEDEGLVIENAGLTEWPVPLLGRFEDDFLEVPPETIQLTARVNQKYFVCEKDGKLANAFICTANIDADDPAVVVEGNRKVLAARLSDAKFFWDVDRKKTLEEHAKGLERITFHEKLGTVAQRQERFVSLADDFQGQLAEAVGQAKQAAAVLKADLVTEMVGEFPELQGLMGGYYANAEGLGADVAAALRDHYKPAGQSDSLPTVDAAIIAAISDKVDALVGFFGADLKPTGSKDPFALRRAALGIIRLITENGLRLRLRTMFEAAGQLYLNQGVYIDLDSEELLGFIADRLKVQQREAGVRHDLIDAVFALGGEDDLVRLLARVKALQSFMDAEDGTNLLAGYKRAANILKKENHLVIPAQAGIQGGSDDQVNLDSRLRGNDGGGGKALSYTPEKAEKALIDALDAAEPKATAAIDAEDFGAAMAALASLRAPIDAFFDEVTVNDEDKDKRAARLDLLLRFRNAVHQVADFSKIEG